MNTTDQRLTLLQGEIDALRQQLSPTLTELERTPISNDLLQRYRESIEILSQYITVTVLQPHSAPNNITNKAKH
jgi:hypothetical protein